MARSVASTTTYKTWAGIQLLNASNLFIVVGQTSDWVAEPDTDAADPTDTAPSEPIVAIRPYLTTMAVEVSAEAYALLTPDKRSLLTVSGIPTYFEHIDEADAYDRAANYLISVCEYNTALGHPESGTDGFRAYYLCAELVPAAGHESDDYLVPAHVDDYGNLFYINNGPVISISAAVAQLPVLMELR